GLKAVEDGIAGELVESLDRRISAAGTDLGILAALVVAVLVATAWLSLTAARALARPLGALTAAMVRLADGDTTIEVEGSDRANETGRMARALEAFRAARVEADRYAAERAAEQEARIRRAEAIESRVS